MSGPAQPPAPTLPAWPGTGQIILNPPSPAGQLVLPQAPPGGSPPLIVGQYVAPLGATGPSHIIVPNTPQQTHIQFGAPPTEEVARYSGGRWELTDRDTGKLVATVDARAVREVMLDFLIADRTQMIPCRWCRMPVRPEDLMEHCRAMAEAGDRVHDVAEIMGT